LKVCLTNKEQGITMIFDEIDRGIGGSTADAVGRRLRLLSDRSQVIVVTHSPQVAAHGKYQWKVEKSLSNRNLPVSTITELDQQDRLTEIARMLSGKEISAEALAAAKKLLS
jgi:DNA repair protein RecN (Recombination protein N)